MAVSPLTIAAPHMSWVPPAASKPAATGWIAPALQSAPSGAGDALAQAYLDAAKKAFLLGLNIALSDADRVSSARAYLRSTQGASSADLQSDPTLGSLQTLAKSIVASRTHHGSAFISIFG